MLRYKILVASLCLLLAYGALIAVHETTGEPRCTLLVNPLCGPHQFTPGERSCGIVSNLSTCERLIFDGCGFVLMPDLWPTYGRLWTCELRGGSYYHCLLKAHR